MLFTTGSIHGRDFETAIPEKMHEEFMDRVNVAFVERTDVEAGDTIKG